MTLPPCKPLRRGDRELIDFLLTPILPGLEPHSDDEWGPRSAASRGLVSSEKDYIDYFDEEEPDMPYFDPGEPS